MPEKILNYLTDLREYLEIKENIVSEQKIKPQRNTKQINTTHDGSREIRDKKEEHVSMRKRNKKV